MALTLLQRLRKFISLGLLGLPMRSARWSASSKTHESKFYRTTAV